MTVTLTPGFKDLSIWTFCQKKKIKKKIRLRSTMYKVMWARIWIITASVFG